MRRLLVFILAMLPLLAGCWDQYAIEQLGFVTEVLVDGEPGHLKVVYRVVVPSKLPSSTNPGSPGNSTTVMGTGRDIYEATRQANLSSSKTLYMGQMQALLLSERYARSGGAQGALDFIVRGIRTRNIAWVVIVPDHQVDAVMSVVPTNAGYPAEALTDMSLNERREGRVPPIRVFQAINDLMSPGRDPAIPMLLAGPTGYRFEGTALFQRGRLVGTLDVKESTALGMLTYHVQQPTLTIPCNTHGTVSALVWQPYRRMSAIVRHGRLEGLAIRLKGALHVSGASLCPIDFADRQTGRTLRTVAASIIVHHSEEVLRRMQELHSDPLGFGDVLRATSPALWSQIAPHWNEVFAQLPIRVEVQLQPDGSGLLNGTVSE